MLSFVVLFTFLTNNYIFQVSCYDGTQKINKIQIVLCHMIQNMKREITLFTLKFPYLQFL